VDRLRDAGRAVFGPTAAAARLESSKAYAKEVMRRAGVRTHQCHVRGMGPASSTSAIMRAPRREASDSPQGKVPSCARRASTPPTVRAMLDGLLVTPEGMLVEEF